MAERELAVRAVGSQDVPPIPEGEGQLQEDRALHIFTQPAPQHPSLEERGFLTCPWAWGACLRRGSLIGTQALLVLAGLVNPGPGGAPPWAGYRAFQPMLF